jgi:hypothetical protein
MAPYTESDIAGALDDIRCGVSARMAAQRWGVPRSTIFSRSNGCQSRKQGAEALQRLSQYQERQLCEWARIQDSLGLAASHSQLKEFAQRILATQGDHEPLGKRWITGFLRRNPEIKTMRGKRIDSKRINGASTDRIKAFFALLDNPEIKNIPSQHRYNMDETGILEGQGSNGLVLGASEKAITIKKQPGSRTWTTIIECISATGQALKPLVIFKGKSVQQQWFPNEASFLQDWQFTASEKGWTDNEIALNWLHDIFIPQTEPLNGRMRLLIVDGHGSHETDDFLYSCFKHRIFIVFLPSHASHVLQPLDVAVFSSLKTAYRSRLSTYINITNSAPINKLVFLQCYHHARTISFTQKNILSGWRATGLWPIAMAKPLMNPLVVTVPSGPIITTPLQITKKKNLQEGTIDTPRHSSQVQKLAKRLISNHHTDPAIRLLFRKISKSIDEQNTKLAKAEGVVRGLEAKIDNLQPKKKQKIEPGPNERFVRIEEVMKAKAALEADSEPTTTGQNIQERQFEALCDVWQA